jgi:translocation and assembly module TamA
LILHPSDRLTRPSRPTSKLLFLVALLSILCSQATLLFAAGVSIHITGVEGEELTNIRTVTQLPTDIVRDGVADDILLDRFVKDIPPRIQDALKPYGYYHAKAETRLDRQAGNIDVTVTVDRGPPVTVSRLRVTIVGAGASHTSLITTAHSFPLKEGGVLRQDLYETAKTELQALAADLGYLDAGYSVHTIAVRTTENTAEVALELDTGPRYFFDGIVFSGVVSYPVDFMRRYLTFKSGDVFSYAKMGQTQANFNNSERFRSVLVTANKEEAHDQQLPVHIDVTEGRRQQMRVGGGYGTDTGPRFILRYQNLNVLSRGHEFQSALDVSQYTQGIATKYIIPSPKDSRTFTSFKLAYLREDIETYTTSAVSFDAERERSFGVGKTGGLFIRFLREQSDIGHVTTTSFVVLPGVRFTSQWYDNLIRPHKGYRLSSELRGTSEFFGSDQAFLQSVNDLSCVYRFLPNYTVFARTRVGWTLQTESLLDMPASLRFFAGGDRSVRGYAYQSLGPKDDDGNVVGGKNVLVGSLELERAIGKDWGLAAFVDAGNAFNDVSQIAFFRSVGLGIRYYTRVGPVSLDLARPLDRDFPVVRVHFTVGFGT